MDGKDCLEELQLLLLVLVNLISLSMLVYVY